MPRRKSYDKKEAATAAMFHFWKHGYENTSMDDLVKITGVSRHSIYNDFGGKDDLFIAVFDIYQNLVVTPALQQIDDKKASLDNIRSFFLYQIEKAEENVGFPAWGCLIVNTMVDITRHGKPVTEKINFHFSRLQKKYKSALQTNIGNKNTLFDKELDDLAHLIVVFGQGLWVMSRNVDTSEPLIKSLDTFIELLEKRIAS